jgi:hypothetical protein
VRQDHPFVLKGQRIGEVGQALALAVVLSSLASEECVYKLVCADWGAGND